MKTTEDSICDAIFELQDNTIWSYQQKLHKIPIAFFFFFL